MRARIYCYKPENAIRGKIVVIDEEDNKVSFQFVSQFSLRLALRLILNTYRDIEIIISPACSQKVVDLVAEVLKEYGREIVVK